MELLQKSHHIEFHLESNKFDYIPRYQTERSYLVLKELVFQRFISGVVSGTFEKLGILGIILGHRFNLLVIFRPRERCQTVRVQFPATGIQLGTVVLAQLCSKRVDRDDDGPAISFKLENTITPLYNMKHR